jgi:hypothetical protein
MEVLANGLTISGNGQVLLLRPQSSGQLLLYFASCLTIERLALSLAVEIPNSDGCDPSAIVTFVDGTLIMSAFGHRALLSSMLTAAH